MMKHEARISICTLTMASIVFSTARADAHRKPEGPPLRICETPVLSAEARYDPPGFVDGHASTASMQRYLVPEEIPVFMGRPGQKTATLQFYDAEKQRTSVCTYRGQTQEETAARECKRNPKACARTKDAHSGVLGWAFDWLKWWKKDEAPAFYASYVFERCETKGRLEHLRARDEVSATEVSLHIEGDPSSAEGFTLAHLRLTPAKGEDGSWFSDSWHDHPWCGDDDDPVVSCRSLGTSCGVWSDGCGGLVNCGPCPSTEADNACRSYQLDAALAAGKTIDAESDIGAAVPFSLPRQLPVIQGQALSDDRALLSFTGLDAKETRCTYGGASTRFELIGCEPALATDALITATKLRLQLQRVASSRDALGVSLALDVEPCTCAPASCESLGATCGTLTDGCGGLLGCGGCADPTSCGADPSRPLACACAALTCEGLGASCGQVSDGCGGTLDCGACPAGTTCGGGGVANSCGCTSLTCADTGASCGSTPDGCGAWLHCGECSGADLCSSDSAGQRCHCEALSCAELGFECGRFADGCGGAIDCDGCSNGASCNVAAGKCEQPVVAGTQDPTIRGATITVGAGEAIDGQAFRITIDQRIATGTTLSSTRGPVFSIGPTIDYSAEGFSTFSFEECATITVPFDRRLLDDTPGATVDDIGVYYVEETAQGRFLIEETPRTVDLDAQIVRVCTTHLSARVVALRSFCDAPVTSPGFDIVGRVQVPPSSGLAEIDSANARTYARVDFAPPNLAVSSTNDVQACVSFLLFYGDDQLSRVCIYNNAQTAENADSCDHNRVTACGNVSSANALRGCYTLIGTGTDPRPPLGSALKVGRIDGQNVWIDRLEQTTGTGAANRYLLVGFLAQNLPELPESLRSSPITDTSGITAIATVRSHPKECRGEGFACGTIDNGCGGTIDCGSCAGGLLCVQGACECPPENPGCQDAATVLCGNVPMDRSNPCIRRTCVNGVIQTDLLPDGTSCTDADDCNGFERCIAQVCTANPAPIVDDGNPCTDDRCTGSVVAHTPTLTGQCSADGCYPMGAATTLDSEYKRSVDAANAALTARCPSCAPYLRPAASRALSAQQGSKP